MYLAVHDSLHEGKRREHRRFLAGVGVSVTVHILLMLAYRTTGPAPVPAVPEPPSFITVRIAPPLPAPPPPRAEPAARQRSAAQVARSARNERKSAPQAVIAVPVSPDQKDAPAAFTVQQADEPAPGETPQFDMNVARQTARQLAGQTKLGREGHANAQFPDPPLETESKLGKAISRAKRRNCKDGIPGGLLAPLFLAMDKKDHGCKW